MYKQEKLEDIYDKTHGYCHLCHKKLSFGNYGKYGDKGAWHVEHSKPKAKGGTDHLNNLFPACIPCNLEKSTSHTNTIRRKNSVTRAPYSKVKKEEIKTENRFFGGIIGFFAAAAIGGPPLAIISATVLGAKIGERISPKR